MAGSGTRTITIKFDGSTKGLVAAAAEAGIAIDSVGKKTSNTSSPLKKLQSDLEGASSKLSKAGSAFTSVGKPLFLFEGAISAVSKAMPVVKTLSGVLGLLPGAVGVAAGAFLTLKLGATGIQTAFKGVADTASKSVSAVFAKQLKPAATDVRDIFKAITPNLDNTAHSFSAVFVQALSVASTKQNMAAWKTTIDASSTAVTNVGGAFGPLIDVVARLFSVAAPIFAALTAGATAWAERLDARVSAAAADGRLAAWINNGIAKFKELSSKVVAGFDSIRNGLSKFASFRLDILQAIWPALAPILTGLGNFISAHPTLAVWILGIGIALNVLSGIISVITPIIAAFDAVLDANPIILILVAIALLVGGFILLWNTSAPFRDFWINLWHEIQAIVGVVVDWVKAKWQEWSAVFQLVGSTIGNIAGGIGRFFTDTIPNAVGIMVGWVQDRWNALLGFFSGLGGRIASIFSGVWNGITNGLKAALNWVIDRLNSISFTIPIIGTHIGFNIPHLALGGAVQAGMPYVVGDGGGPEIFVPGQSGRVIGTQQSADILGSGGDTFDLVFAGEVLARIIDGRLRQHNKTLVSKVKAGAR